MWGRNAQAFQAHNPPMGLLYITHIYREIYNAVNHMIDLLEHR